MRALFGKEIGYLKDHFKKHDRILALLSILTEFKPSSKFCQVS